MLPLSAVLAASAAWDSPLFWAAFIGWILSVVLHEFAHGLVGHLGGDHTVRERGGLSLNPIQYIDPVMSLLLPGLFLLLGGIPLPGGATYVRRDLLRSRAWDSAVSLAGPAMNLLLFLACALPLHPRLGWMTPPLAPLEWTPAQRVLATMALLQLLAVFLNLIPVPPLDGFGAISPFLDPGTREKLTTPPTSTFLFIGLFFVLWQIPQFTQALHRMSGHILSLVGFDAMAIYGFGAAFNSVMIK